MGPLQDLAKRIAENPSNAGELLDSFLVEHPPHQDLNQVGNILGNLQRCSKQFAEVRNSQEGNPEILPNLYLCSNNLKHCIAAFTNLASNLQKQDV